MSTSRIFLRITANHLLSRKTFVNCCFNKQLFNLITRNSSRYLYDYDDVNFLRITMGKRKRKEFENNNGPVIPTEIHLTAVGTGGPGSARALLLSTQYARYLFNCGEATSRIGSVSSGRLKEKAFVNLRNLDNVFITHKSWDNCAGLLSLALSLGNQAKNIKDDATVKKGEAKARSIQTELAKLKKQEAKAQSINGQEKSNSTENGGQVQLIKTGDGPEEDRKDRGPEKQLNIYGPDGVEDIPTVSRKFDETQSMALVKCSGEFSDSIFTITPIIFHEEAHSSEPATKKQRMNSQSTQRGTKPDVAYAYICKAAPTRPKIVMEKVFEAGITVGPDVGKLQRGMSVTLPDGRVVTPDMVTDAVKLNERPFLIVECPTKGFLPQLVAKSELKQFMNPDLEDSLSLVVHMTPAPVYNSKEYQAWMKSFSGATSHLVMNRECGEAELLDTKAYNLRLNLVDSEVFPLLPDPREEGPVTRQSPHKEHCSAENTSEGASDQGQVVKAVYGQFYSYRTSGDKGFNIGKDEFDKESVLQPYLEDTAVIKELAKLKSALKENKEETKGVNYHYPKVVFLGTGSAEGQKMRAQSCILVQLSKQIVVLLDCGEDAYGQLFRFYGRNKASRVLRKLKAIFVSHLHADHHQGLITLLKERELAFEENGRPLEPAMVLAPIQIRRWLCFYEREVESISHLFSLNHHQQHLEVSDSMENNFKLLTDNIVKKELQLQEYQIVKVNHTASSYGVTFTARNGFKLTYSGDTRPCESLISAGHQSDLLIHEATHEDDLIDLARAARHSTFSEAMTVGTKMEAKHVILTHFSQRYAYSVPLEDSDLRPNVGIAFDNMQVCPRTLNRLPKLIPALSAVFADELEKVRMGNFRRSRKQDLEAVEIGDKLMKQLAQR